MPASSLITAAPVWRLAFFRQRAPDGDHPHIVLPGQRYRHLWTRRKKSGVQATGHFFLAISMIVVPPSIVTSIFFLKSDIVFFGNLLLGSQRVHLVLTVER